MPTSQMIISTFCCSSVRNAPVNTFSSMHARMRACVRACVRAFVRDLLAHALNVDLNQPHDGLVLQLGIQRVQRRIVQYQLKKNHTQALNECCAQNHTFQRPSGSPLTNCGDIRIAK